ncbi:nicotinamide mononucleotide transporter [Flavobacterium akiainvivens]|uniref:Nicotinamide riboside transporter PnuC n=1 Tax=Flavobacterium akiainvivens TaxID=1202724 RepID=A0A0M9VIG5_9FLAO|nr:nicotinamide riboside transporter PnuC [Flavobacterium akiainvivens]KOS06626.1 nicotinamide mononucleotide transporter [Flavobacterium akiainvivens]SFQ08790.1 nicotinamide mononucleotide transporter [Flavobacterium akiainvivens]
MQEIYNFLFSQYKNYNPTDIYLELIASVLGIVSVIFSKKNSILLYPAAIISSLIYIYLLWKWNLYGDLIINSYYFYMGIYGWVLWSRKDNNGSDTLKITQMSRKDYAKSLLIFGISTIFVSCIYVYYDLFKHWWASIDTIITGLLFIGTWLLAKRKIENWLFLIAGDIIAIPLFYLKGYTLTSILNVFLTVIAIFGYLEWKKVLPHRNRQP